MRERKDAQNALVILAIFSRFIIFFQQVLLVHPRQAIGRLLNGEDLPRVLLDASIPLPEPDSLGRRLEVGSEVGRVVLTEEDADAVELFAVAVGDGHFDLDGAADVLDRAANSPRECGAGGTRGQHFKC